MTGQTLRLKLTHDPDQASHSVADRINAHGSEAVLAKVTQQLDIKLNPLGTCPMLFPSYQRFLLAAVWPGHLIRIPVPQRQVKYDWPAQGVTALTAFGHRCINYLKSYHSRVKLEIRAPFPFMNISFLQLCYNYYIQKQWQIYY